MRRLRTVGALLLLALLAACDDTPAARLPTSERDLEDAARRGDELMAELAAGRAAEDTLAMIASGELDAKAWSAAAVAARGGTSRAMPTSESADAARSANEASPRPPANPMNERAMARADSLTSALALAELQRRAAVRPRQDSARGVLRVLGSAPTLRVMLERAGESAPLGLSGMPTSELRQLGGFEVVVRGVGLGPRDMAVSTFRVVARDHVPVVDGLLEQVEGRWSVRTGDGPSVRLDRLPAALEGAAGQRVWVTRDGRTAGVISRR
jgi:hypothetical protein